MNLSLTLNILVVDRSLSDSHFLENKHLNRVRVKVKFLDLTLRVMASGKSSSGHVSVVVITSLWAS